MPINGIKRFICEMVVVCLCPLCRSSFTMLSKYNKKTEYEKKTATTQTQTHTERDSK